MPSLSGRTIVITGGSSGLGYVAAQTCASAGASVVLAVRDLGRGEKAAGSISGDVHVSQLDLANLDSVGRFAQEWSGPIDILLNNAGIMMVPQSRTVDGFERHIGTNHLGHFALTLLLLPHVRGRVVTVSSQAHRRGRVGLEDLHWESRAYDRMGAYAQSKLANLLFTLELSRRLAAAGSNIRALAAHPGWAATNLQSHSENRLMHGVMKVGNALMSRDARAGAESLLYAMTKDLPSDSYVGPSGIYEYRGAPCLVGRTPAASDPELAAALWSVSETATGITDALGGPR